MTRMWSPAKEKMKKKYPSSVGPRSVPYSVVCEWAEGMKLDRVEVEDFFSGKVVTIGEVLGILVGLGDEVMQRNGSWWWWRWIVPVG